MLALAELRGTLPQETVAIGLQPERVEMRVGLSPALERRLEGLMGTLVRRLADWGSPAIKRPEAVCA